MGLGRASTGPITSCTAATISTVTFATSLQDAFQSPPLSICRHAVICVLALWHIPEDLPSSNAYSHGETLLKAMFIAATCERFFVEAKVGWTSQ